MSPHPSAVVWLAGEEPEQTLAGAARAAGRADLAVVLAGVRPHGDWLERLVAAAHADTAIATASAMLSDGPWAPSPLPAGELGEAAENVAAHAGRLRPRISEPLAGCVLLRRSALDAAGLGEQPRGTIAAAAHPGDASATTPIAAHPGDAPATAAHAGDAPATAAHAGDGTAVSVAAAIAEFGERCTAIGLGHVIADDVLATGAPATPAEDEAAALDARHPHRPAARELDARPESPIEHALLVASRGLDPLSVTIDARALGPARAGTQVHALELIAALGRTGRVALRIVTPPDLDPTARDALERVDGLTLLPYEQAAAEPTPPTDVVHRPSQVFTASDLALLLPLGRRIVVTHQDLIAYRIPTYHESPEAWQSYRRVTRDVLAAADHVVFFSEHARNDALADDLIDPATASVVPIGVDHHVVAGGDAAGPRRRPAALPDDGAPFLLCLGADLRHKHHPFAIALAAALRAEHGWTGRLVFAGPTGSSGAAAREGGGSEGANGEGASGEGRSGAGASGGGGGGEGASGGGGEGGGRPGGGTVLRLGPVAEEEKAWLLEHAAAVVYPTLYEGFGLIPFEAAAAGTPCLFAAQTALAEVLPGSSATLVAWDAAASAEATAPLLHDGPARTAHVEELRAAAKRYRWDDTAQALVDLYEQVVLAPPRELRRAPRERLALEQRLEETERLRLEEWRRHLAFRAEIGDDGLGLVGPGGVLAAADQRALLALMARPALRRPAMRAARAAYRLAGKFRPRG